jgi:hypothetical protein
MPDLRRARRFHSCQSTEHSWWIVGHSGRPSSGESTPVWSRSCHGEKMGARQRPFRLRRQKVAVCRIIHAEGWQNCANKRKTLKLQGFRGSQLQSAHQALED